MAGWKAKWQKWFGKETQQDKRKYPRKPLQVKITNLQSGFFTYYQSINISAGGMFIQANEPLAVGTPLHIQFSLPNEVELLKAMAEVIRIAPLSTDPQNPSGMGIRFVNLPEAVRRRIQNFVEQPV